jgi:hypothetical protein
MPFSGAGGGAARRGVIAGIKRRVRLVPAGRFRRAGGTNDMVAACSKVKCDAVIKGHVKRRRRRYSLTVTVYNGGTGSAIGRRAARVRGKRRITRAGAAIGRRCLRLIRKGKYQRGAPASKPPPEPVAAAPPPEEKPTAVAKTDTSDIPVYKPPTATKGKLDEEDEEEDEEEGRVTKRASRSSMAGLFDISVAVGMAFRTAQVTTDDANKLLDPNDDGLREYNGSMYPELVAHVDLFPLVLATGGFARGFGIGATFAHHLSISTKSKNDEDVDTTSWELLLDLKYRWNILSGDTSPVVDIFAGYGMRNFTLAMNKTMSSFAYRFVRFGLEGKVPIMTPLFAVVVGFDVRPMLGVGSGEGDAVDVYGTRTGGLAWAIRGGVAGQHNVGFFYFLNFEYLSLSSSFEGLSKPDDLRDGFPDRLDPTSCSDRFIRLWVGGGYAY